MQDPESSNQWLLIANGEFLPHKKLHHFSQNRSVMVLDGAFKRTHQLGIKIDIVLGDFDSIDSQDEEKIAQLNIKKVKAFDQNKNDLEKGILYLRQHFNPKQIVIACALGKRFQHSFYSLLLLKKFYHREQSIIIMSNNETIYYLENTCLKLEGTIKDAVSIFGFPYAKIWTQGLKYEVQEFELHFESSVSSSNELCKKQASIQVEGGALIIYENSNQLLEKSQKKCHQK